eukprot:g5042.t1 g5042   contig18:506165-506503(+)
MVAPGDIDDELATEVKEECEEQCGKVLDVHVMDATSSEEYVRVDVTFENAASASKAVKIFNGRMFGDRKITARMKGGDDNRRNIVRIIKCQQHQARCLLQLSFCVVWSQLPT